MNIFNTFYQYHDNTVNSDNFDNCNEDMKCSYCSITKFEFDFNVQSVSGVSNV